jgi:hypothetical protein
MTGARKSNPVPPASDIADAVNMDRIRDILFGNQANDYENRFSKIEQMNGLRREK